MEGNSHTEVTVIGIGNTLRGDDAAGPLVVRALRAMKFPPDVSLLETAGDGATLMALWDTSRRVILIDAITAGLSPGSVVRVDPRKELVPPSLFATSSHSFGVAQALAISQALGALPESLTLYGIQALSFLKGGAVSHEVEKAVYETAERIQGEIEEYRKNPGLQRGQQLMSALKTGQHQVNE